MKNFSLSLASALVATLAIATPAAHAGTVFTTWVGQLGSPQPTVATGVLNGITVTYTGNIYDVNYVDPGYGWTPSTSYIGGNVTAAPIDSQLSVRMYGGTNATETISFSSPVVNPIIDIFSLGSSSIPASFVFTDSFTIEAGGPSIHYGGGSITNSGDTVNGVEGNGAIEFTGSYSSISFTTPMYEFYYGFTVGENVGAGTFGSSTPEPGTLSLLGLGIGALPVLRRRFLKR